MWHAMLRHRPRDVPFHLILIKTQICPPFKSISTDPTPWLSTTFSCDRDKLFNSHQPPRFLIYISCIIEDITQNFPCSESMTIEAPPSFTGQTISFIFVCIIGFSSVNMLLSIFLKLCLSSPSPQ